MKKICTLIVSLIVAFVYFKFSDSDFAKNVRESNIFKFVEEKADTLKDNETFWNETVDNIDTVFDKIKSQTYSEYKVKFKVENSFRVFEVEIPVSKETYKKYHINDDVTKDMGVNNKDFQIIVVDKRREK